MDNKIYTIPELDELLRNFFDDYEYETENGFSNINCEVQMIDNKLRYFYTFEGKPVYKCIAIRILRLLNPFEKAYRENFNDTLFN